MRRFLSFALLLLFAVAPASADKARILEQKPGSITFVVDENLPEPIDGFINGKSQAERYKFLGQSYYEADGTYIAASFWDQPLSTDNAPFFTGMVRAFADHRPISLSPDLIWMLISQAFSHDVNANPEKFRDKLVGFDGKIDLVLYKTGYAKVVDFSDRLLEFLRSRGGYLPCTDKTDPETIYRMFGVSKKTFKKAVGDLYKKGLVQLEEDGIVLIKPEK